VSVEVTIKSFNGKNIVLEMAAYDEIGQVGKGYQERTVVNKQALLRLADSRAKDIFTKNY